MDFGVDVVSGGVDGWVGGSASGRAGGQAGGCIRDVAGWVRGLAGFRVLGLGPCWLYGCRFRGLGFKV